MDGIAYHNDFIKDPAALWSELKNTVTWDERMTARKTASYGVAYNYSQIQYPYQEMPLALTAIAEAIELTLGFRPNNCLINYYTDGKSKMGFHSDQTDILEEQTGIAIVSLGEARMLRFRNIADKEMIKDYVLSPGALFYMTQEVQALWQHAIPASDTLAGRMSLTFRRIKT